MPTTFTKSAGLLAIVSAVAWIIGLVAVAISAGLPDATRVDPTQAVAGGQTVFFIVGSISLLAAFRLANRPSPSPETIPASDWLATRR